jgi:Ca-activated chloride channel homolog
MGHPRFKIPSPPRNRLAGPRIEGQTHLLSDQQMAAPRPRDPRSLILSLVFAVALVGGLAIYYRPSNCTLEIWSSQEKAKLLGDLANAYNSTDAGGGCTVRVDEVASGTAEQALATNSPAAGKPRPDIWSPAASTWVTLLRQNLPAGTRSDLVPGTSSSIAHSPLVIGMPVPMAMVLGWPNRQLGWADVLRLLSEPDAWAARGHPTWGTFKLGQTDPTISTSGLHAFIGIFSAAVEARDGSNTSVPISEGDVSDPKVVDFVRGVEASVSHSTDTVASFEGRLQAAGDLSYISAIAMEEQEVWQYNTGNPRVPLAAVYPREGTLFADHPYVALHQPWTDSTRETAVRRFLDYLQLPATQAKFQANGFRNDHGLYGIPNTSVINQKNGLLATQPALAMVEPTPAVLQKIVLAWPSVH